jgi:small subunit ribosomal protein S6
MLILSPEADEATVSAAVDRIAKLIEPGGGAVTDIDRWGRRRFAYEIAHLNEGYYVVVRFTADPSVQPQIERVLHIADEVIRHKILQAPPAAEARPERPARETAPEAAARETSPEAASPEATAETAAAAETTASPAPA